MTRLLLGLTLLSWACAENETVELPEAPEPLVAAQEAYGEKRWDEAIELARLALAAEADAKAAQALIDQAIAERNANAILRSATALFDAEQYEKAYVKLDAIPTQSVYSGRARSLALRIRHAVALPEAIRRRGEVPMRRVLVGTYRQGSDDDELARVVKLCGQREGFCKREDYLREQPEHVVELDSFYLDEREVSQRDYAVCVRAGSCAAVDWVRCGIGDASGDAFRDLDLPQVCVDWDEASAYCAWAQARLPSEAEWEKAAAGPRKLRFPWGADFDPAAANWSDLDGKEDGYVLLAPVDAYPPYGYGLRSMAGNAYEWVADWYDERAYAKAERRNPSGPSEGGSRVIRGGAFDRYPDVLRAQHRNRMAPGLRDKTVGFRCAVDAAKLPSGNPAPPSTPVPPPGASPIPTPAPTPAVMPPSDGPPVVLPPGPSRPG